MENKFFLCMSLLWAHAFIRCDATGTANSSARSLDLPRYNYETLLKEVKTISEKAGPSLRYLGDFPGFPASSCQQIASLRPAAKSGLYWIQDSRRPSRVYCQMDVSGCGEGAWTRVANVNMTLPRARCPWGLEKVAHPTPHCRKTVNSGCSSVTFSTYGVPYTKVCGQVIGYQFSTTDAFAQHAPNNYRTIDGTYVDGVSITHSRNPREHIWTFAAGVDGLSEQTQYRCPCSNSKNHVPYTGHIPAFIGNDFYCETGTTRFHHRFNTYYTQDPLWDGQGCRAASSCCEGAGKPWFKKKLPSPVTSDVEVRVCTDQSRADEDVLIKQLLLFVQ